MVMIVLLKDALNVRNAVSNVLAYFANALGSAVIGDLAMRTSQLFLQDAAALRGPLRVRHCAGTLAAQLESTPMAETSVATDVHQALDIHRGFTTQVTIMNNAI
jgi:hypothetical protein